VPNGAAEFAVSDGWKPHRFLQGDGFEDRLVLDGAQSSSVDATVCKLRTRFLEIGRAQERADMIGAEGGHGHGCFLWLEFSSAEGDDATVASISPATLGAIQIHAALLHVDMFAKQRFGARGFALV